jgi:hypothetical protein
MMGGYDSTRERGPTGELVMSIKSKPTFLDYYYYCANFIFVVECS